MTPLPFRPLPPRTLRWRAAEGEGLEHLDIRPNGDGILARSVVIGARGDAPYGIGYEIRLDAGWRVLDFEIRASEGRSLRLASPEPGRWRTAEGGERPDLDGCVDIDLSGTPFTNTLPIRRLAPTRRDGPLELSMLYVPFDTLAPFPDGQRYTALEDGRLYRYEATDRSFAADLPLDEDGLVLDYPGLFVRA